MIYEVIFTRDGRSWSVGHNNLWSAWPTIWTIRTSLHSPDKLVEQLNHAWSKEIDSCPQLGSFPRLFGQSTATTWKLRRITCSIVQCTAKQIFHKPTWILEEANERLRLLRRWVSALGCFSGTGYFQHACISAFLTVGITCPCSVANGPPTRLRIFLRLTSSPCGTIVHSKFRRIAVA